MSVLAGLREAFPTSPECVRLKAAILFHGVQFCYELADACEWAFPNYAPYQIPVGMEPHNGQRRISIPYLLRMEDDTQVRLRIKPDSPFRFARVNEHVGSTFSKGMCRWRRRPLNLDCPGPNC